MGRSFASVRLGVRAMAERWEQAAKSLEPGNRKRASHLAGMAKMHSSAAFFGCDTPMEAVTFSTLAGICREQSGEDCDVDP